MACAIGIDIGSSTTKVAVVEVDHGQVRVIAVHTQPTPSDVPSLLRMVQHGCRTVLTAAEGVSVAAIGVASMAETGAVLDRTGTAVTELVRWDAQMGEEDAAALAGLAADVFAATGVRLAGKTPLTIWRHLLRTRPQLRRSWAAWLGAADLVVHALTGHAVTDHTLAGRTGAYRCTPADSPQQHFDAELLDLVGLVPDRLPRVAAADEAAATVSTSAARTWGLPPHVPVVVAGHDHQVAAWASGARTPGTVVDSLGTAEAVLSVITHAPDPESIRTQGMSLTRTVTGAQLALVAGAPTAGAMLQHWLATVPAAQRASVLERAADAHDADPRPSGMAVLPYLRGRQSPEPDLHARTSLPGPLVPAEEAAVQVLEGMCYQARWMAQVQRDLCPDEGDREVIVVGGTRLPRLWLAIKADTSPWPSRVVTADEPVAAGAGLVALARAGLLGDARSALRHAPVLSAGPAAPGSERHSAAYGEFIERARQRRER